MAILVREPVIDDFWEDPAHVESYTAMAAGTDGAALVARLGEWLPPEASVLELGMGPGVDLQLLARHFARVTGSDHSRAFLQRYRARNPNADLLHLDAVSLRTERRFDAIYSNKVLPYLTRAELRESLRAQMRVLRPSGVALHTFWYGAEEDIQQELRCVYYTEATLCAAFESLPERFELLVLERYGELEEGDSLLLIVCAPPENR